jgi:hypothetical protein
MSRYGGLSMLAVFGIGAALSAHSLLRRQRPVAIPLIGLVMNVSLAVLFCWPNFQAPWFDQDRWADQPGFVK